MKYPAAIMFIVLGFVSQLFAQEKIDWIKNYEKASALSRETGKPMLIDFWAEWCGPCKVMDKNFWPRQDVIIESEKFVMVSLHFERDSQVALKFQASGLPHIVFADPWGNVIARQRGYGNGSDSVILGKMKSMPADFIPVRTWLANLAADKQNKTALENLGNFYRDAKAYELSNNYYRKRLEIAESEASSDDTEKFLLQIGSNVFKLQDLPGAQKIYEDAIKRFPNGKMTERAYASLVTCQAYRKKLPDAEKTFEIFKQKYPGSKLLAEAQNSITQIKNLSK